MNIHIWLAFTCLCLIATGALGQDVPDPPNPNPFCTLQDCGKNVSMLIESKGYPVEQYTVETEDGYLLGVQRIPHGINNGNSTTKRPPVFLLHGLEDASHTWVINFPNQSLGFILADAGYDVWLGNSRGNTYSRNNVHYTTKDKEFWEFSWDEMAKYDLPAMLQFVTNQTGYQQIVHVGHSQGTVQGFAGYENAETADMVKLFVALAPIAYIAHMESPLLDALADLDLATILSVLGFKQFLPSTALLEELLDATCDVDPSLCDWTLCALMGCDTSNWNNTRLPVYVNLDPAGTSVQNMLHYQQGYNKKNFCSLDFGYFGNKKHYGSHHYPCYNLADVQVDVALFSGGQDFLADPADVATLVSDLPPERIVYQYEIPAYSHLDFVWGLDAADVLYPKIIALLEQVYQ